MGLQQLTRQGHWSFWSMIMGGYRLTEGQKNSFYPAILAIISTVAIFVILNYYELNIKNIEALRRYCNGNCFFAVIGLLVAVFWSGWRIFRLEDTLKGVMLETSKTTSMVFIILLGATMLTRLQGIWRRRTG
ncbi:MAG: hypothetical protein CM1200mP30_21180 [Pseudomonadota bacterium]|nr:MAG: hypothetical protein CM1200mP30_21180 [Pseudomonadota bacterium]